MKEIRKLLVLVLVTCICAFALFGCDILLEYGQGSNNQGNGDSIGDATPHEHTLVKHEGKAPTCTEKGWQTYYTCSGCKEYNTYKELDALGHAYSDSYQPNGDVHSLFCSRCSSTTDQTHNWSTGSITKEPTCTDNGSKIHVCTVCNVEKTSVVLALGHDYSAGFTPNGNVHSSTCSRCDKTVHQAHEWSEGQITKHPTCVENGVETFTCSICNGEKNVSIASLGHDYALEYQPDGDVHSRQCTRCESLDSASHEWQLSTTNNPTCTENGENIFICLVCNGEKKESISALGHDFSGEYQPNGDVHSRQCSRCTELDSVSHEWSLTLSKSPSCTEYGEEAHVCSVCNYEKNESISPLGHDFSGEYQPNGDVHSIYCSRCSATSDELHSWQIDAVIIAPTCVDEGVVKLVCSVCQAIGADTTVALGHDYAETPVQNGDIHSYVCSRCDESINETHEWGSGNVINEVTCLTDGLRVYECNVCKATKNETLTAPGHDFGGEYKIDGDTHTLTCSRCPEEVSNPHEWSVKEYIAPDCANAGYRYAVCTVCNTEVREKIPATDEHFDGEWEIYISPTAFNEGLKVLRCAYCNNIIGEQTLSADVDSMPIIYLEGDYLSATAAKNEVQMSVSYVEPNGGASFDGYATIKVQGASSVNYAKKNYTIKFYKDETFDKKLKVDLGWGKESKYVMKANWVDAIQARNVVSCRLWGDMVLTRPATETQQRLAALSTNGGAIDGYPIAVFMNGQFHGIYTMNVPKDEWMFGMDDSETEALLCADDWNNTNFSTLIGYFKENSAGDLVTDGWELKYCGSDDYAWVTDSFNALIQFCWDNEGEAFKAGISEHLDVDAAIDYLIYQYVVFMRDNSSKNMLWATYDGKVWIPSVYDQDGVFGQVWDGKRDAPASSSLPKVRSDGTIDVGINFGPGTDHLYEGKYFILWDRIWNAFTEEILVRYKQLRETTLSYDNIVAEFEAFRACIPESVYTAEFERWESERNAWWGATSGVWYEKYNYDYIYAWQSSRFDYLDSAMRNIYNKVYLPSVSNPII